MLKDDKLNVLLQVNSSTLAKADSIIQQATKMKIIPCLAFPLLQTFYNVHVVVFSSVIQIYFLSLQTWLIDKSRYKVKQVNQPRQPLSENVEEPPHAVMLLAGMQTGDVVLEVEEDRNEQEDLAILAESLDLGGCTVENEDSGLDSVSEDDF